jgi:hypothetical protein
MRRLRAGLILGGSLIIAQGVASQASLQARPDTAQSLEYQVKAAYLLNFTRYIEWPSGISDSVGAPVTICVLGADPFGQVLDATVAGRTSHGRPLNVRRIRSAREAAGCRVVFVTQATWRRNPAILSRLGTLPALTVGESEQFAREGGTIAFVIRDQRVRFVVNAHAGDRVGLRISSRMLSLAAAVYDGDRR